MIILADTKQKPGYHPEEDALQKNGHSLVRLKLPVGDYCVMTIRCMDMFKNREHEIYTSNKFFNTHKSKNIKLQPQDTYGTYTISVDVKQDCRELQSNLLSGRFGRRYRFERECMRARNMGVKLYIVIADDTVKCEEDFRHLKKYGSEEECGQEMLNKMEDFVKKYGCTFLFTTKDRLPSVIEQILMEEQLPWAV